MCITFVSCFFQIYEKDYDTNKSMEWRIERFREIASTGIKLCVYVNLELLAMIPREYENVIILEMPTSHIERLCANMELELPQQRSVQKDTHKYMCLMNAKTEFVADAIERNLWNSTHFAWIDFNVSYIFKEKNGDKERTLRFLKELDLYKLPDNCMLMPGCWTPYDNVHIAHVTECIFWRFCGGFFIGDAKSLLKFDDLYKYKFETFWAWLEVNSDWKPQWYSADHNDSIITNLPCANLAMILSPISEITYYDYPAIPLFHPSSASYLCINGEHILNTRYVNYWFNGDGTYLFYDGSRVIQNKNFCSRLVFENGTSIPADYDEMNENTIDLPRYPMYSRGIEDIRLYQRNGKARYIATSVGYHTTGGNRMVVGNYDYKTRSYSDSRVIAPPTDTYCEKNWVPLPGDRDLFVYKWAPLEIGEILENKKLIIVQTHPETTKLPFFNRMKGSTQFIEHNGELIGVTHFSEDATVRRYFHMLVVLDKTTYAPLRYSQPFVFEKFSIEFCIGFDITDDKYRFWISRFDRDPALFEVKTHIISFVNIYAKSEETE
jgi:hypothetical protein